MGEFTKANYIGLLAGVGLLAVGFYFLSIPPVDSFLSMNVAPIVLTIAYCVVFPIAILKGKKEDHEDGKGA